MTTKPEPRVSHVDAEAAARLLSATGDCGDARFEAYTKLSHYCGQQQETERLTRGLAIQRLGAHDRCLCGSCEAFRAILDRIGRDAT